MISFKFKFFTSGPLLRAFLFCLLLLLPVLNASERLETPPYHKKEWARLLHAKKSFFGGHQFKKAPGFYLSSGGKPRSLKDEWNHLLELLHHEKLETRQETYCRFPARVKWASSYVESIDLSKLDHCPDYHHFIERMDVESVSLVFSSYYLESPASAFGHTLLRFHRKGTPGHRTDSKLLDFGINYAATVTTENALLYAIYGIS